MPASFLITSTAILFRTAAYPDKTLRFPASTEAENGHKDLCGELWLELQGKLALVWRYTLEGQQDDRRFSSFGTRDAGQRLRV